MNDKTSYTADEWRAESRRRFGVRLQDYRFKCPRCGNVATGEDFKKAGANPNAMYTECIGRYNAKTVGCDWAAYGLFDICKIHVDGQPVFEFAD